MFAEFELKAHELVESGKPATTEVLRKIYTELLELYFGEEMHFENKNRLSVVASNSESIRRERQ